MTRATIKFHRSRKSWNANSRETAIGSVLRACVCESWARVGVDYFRLSANHVWQRGVRPEFAHLWIIWKHVRPDYLARIVCRSSAKTFKYLCVQNNEYLGRQTSQRDGKPSQLFRNTARGQVITQVVNVLPLLAVLSVFPTFPDLCNQTLHHWYHPESVL